jgi:hypothetical protein
VTHLTQQRDRISQKVGKTVRAARTKERRGLVRSGDGCDPADARGRPLHAGIESYFATAPAAEVEKVETIDKDHGRFEVRNYSVSHQVDWYAAERSYPGAPRFPQLTTIAIVAASVPPGTLNTRWTFSARRSQSRVNLDSLPWPQVSAGLPPAGFDGMIVSRDPSAAPRGPRFGSTNPLAARRAGVTMYPMVK